MSNFKPTINIGGVERKLNTVLAPRAACMAPTISGAGKLVPPTQYVDVDLFDDFPTGIADQGDTMICVGEALVKAAKSLCMEQGMGAPDFTPWFPYNLISPNDNGASIADALGESMKVGLALDDGTLPSRFMGHAMQQHYPALMKAAADYRVEFGFQVMTWEDIVSAVQRRHRIMIGVPVFESWSDVTRRDPVVRQGGRLRGWHCIYVGGYRAQEKLLRFQNSWSPGWAEGGYAWIGRRDIREPLDGIALESLLYTAKASPLLRAA